jgi:hypothetical protein
MDSAGSENGLVTGSYEHGMELNMREISLSVEQLLSLKKDSVL